MRIALLLTQFALKNCYKCKQFLIENYILMREGIKINPKETLLISYPYFIKICGIIL